MKILGLSAEYQRRLRKIKLSVHAVVMKYHSCERKWLWLVFRRAKTLLSLDCLYVQVCTTENTRSLANASVPFCRKC